MTKAKTLIHGGDLQSASKHYGIPIDEWIDLSTGINPSAYPVEALDSSAYQCLPYLKPEFIQAAQAYYGREDLLAVSGSQAVIQLLPECLPELPILLPSLGYQEHRHQWEQSQVTITNYPSIEHDAAIEFINDALQKNNSQHLLVINPNNPSGIQFSPLQLQAWAQQLAENAYLIIDEAFIDVTPDESVLTNSFEKNMIVLRSFGKFFGLAGLRLGFVFSNEKLLGLLQQRLGLWMVNGPAQSIATLAFKDELWQQQTRINLEKSSRSMQALFAPLFDKVRQSTQFNEVHHMLFSSYYLPKGQAEVLSIFFAKQGVLLRWMSINDELDLLRIGLLSKNTSDIKSIELIVCDAQDLLKGLKPTPVNNTVTGISE